MLNNTVLPNADDAATLCIRITNIGGCNGVA